MQGLYIFLKLQMEKLFLLATNQLCSARDVCDSRPEIPQ